MPPSKRGESRCHYLITSYTVFTRRKCVTQLGTSVFNASINGPASLRSQEAAKYRLALVLWKMVLTGCDAG